MKTKKKFETEYDTKLFLDELANEFIDIVIQQTKKLIVAENAERFEECAKIQKYLDELIDNVSQTISSLTEGLDKEEAITTLNKNRLHILEQLRLAY